MVVAAAVLVPDAEPASPVTAVTPATLQPNDPYWRQSWSQAVLRMPEVWARSTGSPDVVIAMVDSGVNPAVADLAGALVPGWDFTRNDAVPRDAIGHGTQVASVIAARGNNGIGIAGYCWGCRLMPVRVTADGTATGPQIARGIYWAVDHGARIITIGLNSGSENNEARAAVGYARERGVLVIASAGNTGTDERRYPAGYEGALPVAAVNDSDALYFWSSRGNWVPLAAPGCQLVFDPWVGPGTQCGTSYTPAVVAGIAGLMLSLRPSLTPAEVEAVLRATAVPVQGINGGRINPLAALEAVAPTPAPPPTVPTLPAGGDPGITVPVPVPPATRELELGSGVIRSNLTRVVRVGAGRLDIHLRARGVVECQISLRTPAGQILLSLLPPGDSNLLSMSQRVKAGRHRIEIDCASSRRRAYTISISHVAAPKSAAAAKSR